ncbi:MAG: hypothetical protein JSU81_09755 [Candidatus Coatesbacteria bacterium]|nr:MAG: hypothetical protein JSU81_09755 [Candidatus Coatesbacteria bacterium]
MENRRLTPSLMLAAAASLLAACGGSAREGDMTLVGEGYVKISGGCECYTEATIHFAPAAGGNVRVELDNAGAWFYADNVPRESFARELPPKEAAAFFGEMKAILDNPRRTNAVSTRAAVVEVYLPLRGGTVEATWRELEAKYDVNPLVDLLEEFVEEWDEEA